MPIMNYTTSIEAAKSVSEIQIMLGKAGSQRVLVSFEKSEPVAVVFELGQNTYMLPCRAEAVYKLIEWNTQVPKGLRTRKQALRIAWRILKDWTAAQLAIIETTMVSADEVFLPYMLVPTPAGDNKQTMYESYKQHQLLLDKPKESA